VAKNPFQGTTSPTSRLTSEEAAIEGQFPLPSDADQGLDDTETQDEGREENGENDSLISVAGDTNVIVQEMPRPEEGRKTVKPV
jgi:hypothetical protein